MAPIKEIGERLRGLRAALDLSVEDLAEKTGAPVEDVQRFETGQYEIPVSYLMDVAHACGVGLTVLLTGGEEHLSRHSYIPDGKGLSVDRRKDYDYRNLAYTFRGRKMEPFLITAPPKPESQRTFTTHSGQEFIYMLGGRLEVTLGDDVQILEPGDSLYFDSNTPHAMRGLDDTQAVFLDVII